VDSRRAIVRDRAAEDAVIRPLAERLGEAWAVCAAIQIALWLVQRRTRNAGIVDVGWALSFAIVAIVFAATATSDVAAWLPIALVIVAWSVRLGGYLITRGAATGPEEGRYVELRRAWAPTAQRAFFVFFQAQAALVAVLATAFVMPFLATPSATWPRVVGALVSALALAGETVADLQLARWRRDPQNRGKVCDAGLWAWSRHPNYFFEWCVWLGYAIYGLAFGGWGAIALAPQAIILASIFGITGIPPTEAQALRSRGDAYRAYQERVSRFIPRRPKRAGSASARSGDS
jgi:steroid 5-alpha reductase family enzyme